MSICKRMVYQNERFRDPKDAKCVLVELALSLRSLPGGTSFGALYYLKLPTALGDVKYSGQFQGWRIYSTFETIGRDKHECTHGTQVSQKVYLKIHVDSVM